MCTTIATPNILSPDCMYDDRTHMHSMVKYKSFDFLKNATLRVVIPYIDPPNVNYVNFSDAAAVEFGYGPGVIMEILKDISESLNLSYKIINMESRKWGMHRSELWTGALGKLLNGEADILVGATIMEYDRSLKVDFSYPFRSELTGMLIYLPEEYESHAFLIVTQPFGWKPRSWSVRVLIALWWLASITLMATFTGSLVALFAVDKIHLPFQNIEQLVKVVKQRKYTFSSIIKIFSLPHLESAVLLDSSASTGINGNPKASSPVNTSREGELPN
uniref:Lig_chan-Glu_bd domain-containing protein n=1 Tax=Heterorhabditis bacteriophora TaxID=37862 RepID=A0A1I7XQ34_HETBA